MFGSAQIEVLRRANEVGGELCRSEANAFPFRYRFALLLVTFFRHQIHCFLFGHVSGVNALIENSVANRPESHLQLLHFHFGSSVSLFCHHLLAIDGPALDEWSASKNCADQSRRAKFVGVRELQVMSGHRFVDRQIVNHVVVVFAKERFLSFF